MTRLLSPRSSFSTFHSSSISPYLPVTSPRRMSPLTISFRNGSCFWLFYREEQPARNTESAFILYIILFLLTLASCSSPAPASSSSGEVALYVYRLDPPALLRFAADRSSVESEIPFQSVPGCSLTGLYPSPDLDLLAAEYACPNGPVSLLFSPAQGTTHFLINDPAVDSHFLAFAADGRSAYLRVNSMADPRILRVEVGTLRAKEIPIDPYTYDLSASPDGKRVLFSFSHGIGLGSEMWLAHPDGRGGKRLLADPGNILAFARWSPDGKQIAFIKIPDTQSPYSVGELWVMDADGSDLRKLADADAGHGYAAAWSPDGERLAFVVRTNPEDPRADQLLDALISNIAVVDVRSGVVTPVTRFTRGRTETPLWSPDGNTLGFTFVVDGRMDVLFSDLAGGAESSLLGESVCCPVWMRK